MFGALPAVAASAALAGVKVAEPKDEDPAPTPAVGYKLCSWQVWSGRDNSDGTPVMLEAGCEKEFAFFLGGHAQCPTCLRCFYVAHEDWPNAQKRVKDQ